MPHLLDLPPELRNIIYALVFSTPSQPQTNLLQPNPPDKTLLLSCQQIYNEANLVYKHTYRSYWNNTPFTLSLRSSIEGKHTISSTLPIERDLRQIKNLVIIASADAWSRGLAVKYATLLDIRGAWKTESHTIWKNRENTRLSYVRVSPRWVSGKPVVRSYKDELSVKRKCAKTRFPEGATAHILAAVVMLEKWMAWRDQQ